MLNSDILRQRLKDTFGNESQENIGRKLDMTQGNVSKLLSGQQLPTIDTLYNIAEKYNVSIDWLLGISEPDNSHEEITYKDAALAVIQMAWSAATMDIPERGPITLNIVDPLLIMLIKKGRTLSKADHDFYLAWIENNLSLFSDKKLLWRDVWENRNVDFLAGEAGNKESNWLEVYKAAKKEEDFYAQMITESPGPFDD